MKMKRVILFVLSCALSLTTLAQAIENTTLYRSMGNTKSLRVNFENDFFSDADWYYTQGVQIECIQPFLKKNPFNYILIHPQDAKKQYGLAFEHDAYTPLEYTNVQLQVNDRPFAAVMTLQSFLIATREKDRISTTFSIGIIGQAAGGQQMMIAAHKITGSPRPEGWDNQIQNDAVLNYDARYERLLFNPCPYFLFAADGLARVGTLNDKITVGVTAMAGLFQNPFGTNPERRKWQIYVYDHPGFSVIGYDATMQGGLFNHSSPYTIPPGDITRGVFRNIVGVVFRYKSLYAEYFQTYITKEFSTGFDHHTGGFQLGFGIE